MTAPRNIGDIAQLHKRPLLVSAILITSIAIAAAIAALLCVLLTRQAEDFVSHQPTHVVLKDDACHELTTAKLPDGRPATAGVFPCSYTGYIFPTKIKGLIAIYGVSANVKDQCLLLSADIVDVSKSFADHDYPPMPTLPDKCKATFHNGPL